MTAYTKKKLDRTFDSSMLGIKKERKEPAEPRHIQACKHCKLPMKVAEGQVAYYHKECRFHGRYKQ